MGNVTFALCVEVDVYSVYIVVSVMEEFTRFLKLLCNLQSRSNIKGKC